MSRRSMGRPPRSIAAYERVVGDRSARWPTPSPSSFELPDMTWREMHNNIARRCCGRMGKRDEAIGVASSGRGDLAEGGRCQPSQSQGCRTTWRSASTRLARRLDRTSGRPARALQALATGAARSLQKLSDARSQRCRVPAGNLAAELPLHRRGVWHRWGCCGRRRRPSKTSWRSGRKRATQRRAILARRSEWPRSKLNSASS